MQVVPQTAEDFQRLIQTYTEEQFKIISDFAIEYFKCKKEIDLRCDFSKSRSLSRGGTHRVNGVQRGYVTLALTKYTHLAFSDQAHGKPQFDNLFTEYNSYKESWTIGSIRGYWTNCLQALLCHEISHAIHLSRYTADITAEVASLKNDNKISNHDGKFHGNEFKAIYKVLREVFVNPYIADCTKNIPPTTVEYVAPVKKREYKKSFVVTNKKSGAKTFKTVSGEPIGYIESESGGDCYYYVEPMFDKTMDGWYVEGTYMEARKSLFDAYKVY